MSMLYTTLLFINWNTNASCYSKRYMMGQHKTESPWQFNRLTISVGVFVYRNRLYNLLLLKPQINSCLCSLHVLHLSFLSDIRILYKLVGILDIPISLAFFLWFCFRINKIFWYLTPIIFVIHTVKGSFKLIYNTIKNLYHWHNVVQHTQSNFNML